MKVAFDFEGLEELQHKIEQIANDTEIKKTNKKIFQRSVEVTQPRMKAHVPRSSDNSKSGKRGYRPSGHAADNIPTKVTVNYGEVGWKLNGDAENWFYMKFVEWGTTRQPPQDFIYNTRKESDDDYSRIANEEYKKFLDSKLED